MLTTLETNIIKGLLQNEEYTRKVLPYIKDEYFETTVGRTYYELCKKHFSKYNECPTKDSIRVGIEELEGIS